MERAIAQAPSSDELDQLVQMLLGSSREELWHLWEPQDEGKFAQQLSMALADAVRSAEHTPAFRAAIAPVITEGVMDTARRQPQKIGDALAPALGPAIRSMVRLAMDDINERIESGVRQTFSIDGLRWRWQAFRSGVPFGDVVLQHTRRYRVEHVMLIHRTSGTLLNDISRSDYNGKDAAVVASMLSAVTHFVADAFVVSDDDSDRQTSTVDRSQHRQFEVGSLMVKVEVMGELVLAAVIRGTPSADVSSLMIQTLELLQSIVGDAADHFDGDLAPFIPVEHLLHDCLVEQKLTAPAAVDAENETLAKPGFIARYAAMAMLLVGVAALSWDTHRRSEVFADYQALIEQQPGVVITNIKRANVFGRPAYHISGLLDPHGKHPAALPRESLFDLTWDLRAYMSLDPEITERRVIATLKPSSGVQVNVNAATLELSGIATADWLAVAQSSTIPGIMKVDSSRLFIL